MGKVERTCPICNDTFKPFGDYKKRKQKYCSKKCWLKRNPPKKKECFICKKEFITYTDYKIYCSMACRNKGMIGKKASDATKKKMSDAKQGYIPVNIFKKGRDHPFYLKDRSKIDITQTIEYKDLRIEVFKRDDYACNHCQRRGSKGYRPILHMHHIKARKDYPELIMAKSNCVTLCKPCHTKTESYLQRW